MLTRLQAPLFSFLYHFISAKICQDEPKKYNSSCEQKENNGIAGFYSDETYEEESKTPNEYKNSRPYNAYRSLIRKSVSPKRVKGEGRLVEALKRLTSKNKKGNQFIDLMVIKFP